MAYGTGVHVIGGKQLDIRQAQRSSVGSGGLVQQGLTVSLRGRGGYSTSVKTGSVRLGAPRTDTLIRKPRLKVPRQPTSVKRVGLRRPPVSDALALRPRSIS
jgi:hypothetical protein